MRNYISKLCDWNSLFETVQNYTCLISLIKGLSSNLEILNYIKIFDGDKFVELSHLINKIIDFSESSSDKISVRSGISEELDSLKRYYYSLEDFLTHIADEDMKHNKFPDIIDQLSIVYLPQLGFLIMVPINENIPQGDLYSMKFQFSDGGNYFYKNPRTIELDEECGDIDGIITDIEYSIVRQLSENVLKYSKELLKFQKYVAFIDTYCALAKSAINHNFTRPKITKGNDLFIKDGRHPLQEISVDGDFIPNDTEFVDQEFLHIITGPNHSGKSVYLKQIGVIVYLSHIGSFVPAKFAKIGITNMIFTRIQTHDDITSSLSTFSSDICQISYMLKNITNRSLLLIDEFGKGTSIQDGVALFISVVNYLSNKNNFIAFDKVEKFKSKIVITTHLHEIFNYKLLKENKHIKLLQMNTVFEKGSNGELVYLYKLEKGVSLLSYGIECAKKAGVPLNIINRAKDISKSLKEGKKIKRVESDNLRNLMRKTVKVIEELCKFDGNSSIVLLRELQNI